MAVAFNKLLGTFAEKQNSQELVRWDVFDFKTAGIKLDLRLRVCVINSAHAGDCIIS